MRKIILRKCLRLEVVSIHMLRCKKIKFNTCLTKIYLTVDSFKIQFSNVVFKRSLRDENLKNCDRLSQLILSALTP